ncbi:MAG TPA: redoxin family protein [Pirellulales bacterium]|nr:redoxin family protein [Pirellulales bacterium]
MWHTSGTKFEDLQGKPVLVLSFVTWCPLCGEWSPDLFKQIKQAAADKPVVVLAISTEAPTKPGHEYTAERGLMGPNILDGYDPAMTKKFDLDQAQLFNYVLIDAGGKVVKSGPAGTYFDQAGGKKSFAAAQELAKLAGKGKFAVISADMSESLKKMLWPMELGQPVNDTALAQARKTLKPDDVKQLDAAIARYLGNQLDELKKLAAGDLPARLAAFDKATALSTRFKATEPGKEARQIVNDLHKDKGLKRELLAKTAYAKLLQAIAGSPDRSEALLKGFMRTYDGTYYAQLASQIGSK